MSKLSVFGMLFLTLLLVACGVNGNIMFKQPKDVVLNSDEIPLNPKEDYRIAPNDKMSFQMFANEGSELLESGSPRTVDETIEYVVQKDGTVTLPKIGKVMIAGLSIEECEDTLTSKYSVDYVEPFIKVKITNQRVIVFPGNGSDAQVVLLTNANTTLMEAIAMAGGITDRGKASTVKLMRIENGVRKVYVMDLSVIEGLKFADLVVQANDYIYVEPAPELGKEFTERVVPIASLASTLLVLLTFLLTL